LYPERRARRRPATGRILRLLSVVERHTLLACGGTVRVFEAGLTLPQIRVPDLLGVPTNAYRDAA